MRLPTVKGILQSTADRLNRRPDELVRRAALRVCALPCAAYLRVAASFSRPGLASFSDAHLTRVWCDRLESQLYKGILCGRF
jgi:hypothetical protein